MITIGTGWEPDSPMLGQLRRLAQDLPEPADIRAGEGLKGRVDILAALDGRPPEAVRADILITDSPRAAALAESCGARTVITVGLSPRDTLTPSSMLSGGMATLQRELVAPDGRIIAPREVDLGGMSGSLTGRLATAAILLLLDSSIQ